jgi:hypothetical protein
VISAFQTGTQEDIFPDAMSVQLRHEGWQADAKALEHHMAQPADVSA